MFGCILDRPLALGFLRQQIDAKLARAAAIEGPKLVILAGSNGPYSHRCEIIEPILAHALRQRRRRRRHRSRLSVRTLAARRCTRAISVYLPMEEAQYVRTRAATAVGPDAAIMFRHDWRTLASLPPERWLAALFSFDLRAALMGPIEAALLLVHFHDPRAEVTGATNAWGDHVGHTAELAAASQAVLATAVPNHVPAEQIRAGYGSALIAGFTRWASAPRDARDRRTADRLRRCADAGACRAIRSVYTANGGDFLVLPNFSRYPRSAFFDTAEHLNETWQVAHSKLLAEQLRWHRAPIAAARPADPAGPPAPRNKPTD